MAKMTSRVDSRIGQPPRPGGNRQVEGEDSGGPSAPEEEGNDAQQVE